LADLPERNIDPLPSYRRSLRLLYLREIAFLLEKGNNERRGESKMLSTAHLMAGTYMMTTMMIVAGTQAMMLLPTTTTPLLREKQLSNTERVRAKTGEQTCYIQKKSPEKKLLTADHRRVSNPYHHTKRLSRAA
jgi:hypothetical protein